MVNTIMHEISFSFDQPDGVLSALLNLVQQRQRQPSVSKTSRDLVVRNALTILIIDTYQQRAQYLGNLLLAVGYRPVIVANALDAFTLFLRGDCLPLAIVLGQADGSNRLFLNRLLQQLAQRYEWDPLMVHLNMHQQTSWSGGGNNQSSQSNQSNQPASPLKLEPFASDVSTTFDRSGRSDIQRSSTIPLGRSASNQLPWPGIQPPVPNVRPTSPTNTNLSLPPAQPVQPNQPGFSAPSTQSLYGSYEERSSSYTLSPSAASQQPFSDNMPIIPPYQEIASRPAAPSQSVASLYPSPPQTGPGPTQTGSVRRGPVQTGPSQPVSPSVRPSAAPERPQAPSSSPSQPPTATPASSAESQRITPPQIKKDKVYLDGQSLGRYQVRSRLGHSEYSEVYQVYDRLREKEYALKVIQVDVVPYYMMRESLEEITVFEQEADLLGQLKHPHILPVLNNGKTYTSGANFIYKVMPLCTDGHLGSWLRRNGKGNLFTYKELLPIVLQLADALQFVHNFQFTFQNFKMNNILILEPTKKIQKVEVAFSDFSVVQDGSFLPSTLDSLAYIAPERWDGVVHPASDQYGLAAIAYELFTGRVPFQANSEHIMKILHTSRLPQPPSSLNPKLPIGVNAVLLRALAKNPAERFASMQYFIQALEQC